MVIEPGEIISFWFETSPGECVIDEKRFLWWEKDLGGDKKIREKYTHLFIKNHRDYLYYINQWMNTAEGCLAAIILVDQFPRHIYRDQALAYAFDSVGIRLCYHGLSQGHTEKLHPIQKIFFYLPLEHSEQLLAQILSVQLYQNLYEENIGSEYEDYLLEAYNFAVQHKKVIEKFGRFPYRNKPLKRISSSEENEWLQLI